MTLAAEIRLRRGEFVLEVALEVSAGETVALLGPNGAGKSTLVDALAGLTPLSEGEVVVDGEVWERPADGIRLAPQQRSLGVMFQGLALFPALSAVDNVAYGPRAQGVARAEARATALELMERFGIAGLAGRKPAQLSGGQAQRVALARALAVEPAVLLLDEPTSALDVEVRGDARRALRRALGDFSGVKLIVTHEPIEAMMVADRLVVVENGRVTQDGSPEEIRRRPRSGYVAALSGVNLIEGAMATSDGQSVFVGAGSAIVVASNEVEPGAGALAAISPRAITISNRTSPTSARNVLEGVIEGVDMIGDRARLSIATSPPLVAEVTAAAVTSLNLIEGATVWASFKATEVKVYPA